MAPVGVTAVDQQQVAEPAFHHLALDGRLVRGEVRIGIVAPEQVDLELGILTGWKVEKNEVS